MEQLLAECVIIAAIMRATGCSYAAAVAEYDRAMFRNAWEGTAKAAHERRD